MSSLREVLSRPTSVIHVLVGPRQVGKTTIARQIQDSISIPTVYATADSPLPSDAAWIDTRNLPARIHPVVIITKQHSG